MRCLAAVLGLAGVLGGRASAKPVASGPSHYVLKEYHPVPEQWVQLAPAPKDSTVHLEIGLKQSRFDELERQLYEVSDPDHPRYGQHLSDAQVSEFVKPTEEALDLVHAWLREHGIEFEHVTYSSAKDWIYVSLPVSRVEALLDAEYSVFQHKEDSSRLIRTPQWSLPNNLHEHIDVIAPTNSFFRPTPQSRLYKRDFDHTAIFDDTGTIQTLPLNRDGGSTASSGGNTIETACNFTAVTPACLRTLYGTVDYKPAATASKIGLSNFLRESNNISDVNLFLQQFRPEAAHAAKYFHVNKIHFGKNGQKPNDANETAAGKDIEGDLDAETIIGMTYPIALETYNTGGRAPFVADESAPDDTNEPYFAFTKYILDLPTDKLPQTISTSYGDDEQTVPLSYAKRVCQHYAQIGSRGVSLLFSSGDSGVGPDGKCISNDGKKTPMFIPSFSSTCPFVTSVGGTMGYPEVVAYDSNNGYSPGGGFSNVFKRPSYQDAAVTAYLDKLGTRHQGLYNPHGRAYPDISAQSVGFVVTWGGLNIGIDGTSAACPTAASVIALVNDALLAQSKPPLGFLNTWLYKTGYKAFTDVTEGSNRGCNTTGFPAEVGWDPASGWGSPNFKTILTELGFSL